MFFGLISHYLILSLKPITWLHGIMGQICNQQLSFRSACIYNKKAIINLCSSLLEQNYDVIASILLDNTFFLSLKGIHKYQPLNTRKRTEK